MSFSAARARRWRFSYETFEDVALAIAVGITRRHYAHEPPYTVEDLSEVSSLPQDMVEKVLAALEAGAFVKRTADEPPAYVIAMPPEETRVANLITSLRDYRPALSRGVDISADENVAKLRADVARAVDAALGEQTLKTLAGIESKPTDG